MLILFFTLGKRATNVLLKMAARNRSLFPSGPKNVNRLQHNNRADYNILIL